MNKHVGVGAMQVYHINILHSRNIGLQASKSTLLRHLLVETSNPHMDQENSLNIVGSVMLWVIPWPTNGKVQDCVDKAVTSTIRRVK